MVAPKDEAWLQGDSTTDWRVRPVPLALKPAGKGGRLEMELSCQWPVIYLINPKGECVEGFWVGEHVEIRESGPSEEGVEARTLFTIPDPTHLIHLAFPEL